jgi:hypothetical protein
MNNNLKEQIIKILETINYTGDKEKCTNDLLGLCTQQMVLDITSNLPQEKLDLLKQKPKGDNPEKTLEVLEKVVGEEEIAKSLEKATQDVFQDWLKTVEPTLSNNQKDNLKIYFEELQKNSSVQQNQA